MLKKFRRLHPKIGEIRQKHVIKAPFEVAAIFHNGWPLISSFPSMPPERYAAPVLNQMTLHKKSLCKNRSFASGGANNFPTEWGAQIESTHNCINKTKQISS